MNIKEILNLYQECTLLTKELIFEIYDELNALLQSIPEEDVRSYIVQGADIISFNTDGHINFYNNTAKSSVCIVNADMKKLCSINGMHMIAYIDVNLRSNSLKFGFDYDIVSNVPTDFIPKYQTHIKSLFGDSCDTSDYGFYISLEYFM